ncbi:hypothetical protein lerEdw1_019968 [Lerista edwardsae]|nr:hypothetical protein lerEdw1_019968 [Lerista edwardsae]
MSTGRRRGEVAGKRQPATPPTQPPRILVVDIHGPTWAPTCQKLCGALENVLALACSLAGPPRIPLLSLYVAWKRQECLLPFTPVRGNFARLQGCLAELRALPVAEGAFRAREHLVAQVVQDGLQQFKQYTQRGMAGATLDSSSVEVTILTGRPGTEVVTQLEAALQGTDLVSLRQLQVVEISGGGFQGPSEAESSSCARGGAGRGSGDHPVALGTDVDLQAVENDIVALEMFFKGWFHDHSTDREHLRLLLPAGAGGPPAAAAPGASLACLKCDAQERLLSPALLPAACGEGTGGPLWMAACRGPAAPRLRVIRYPAGEERVGALAEHRGIRAGGGGVAGRLPTSEQSRPQKGRGGPRAERACRCRALEAGGLCQSLLFGLPLVLRPTNCWQLSWEELEVNLHGFQALCHCLRSMLDGLEVEPAYNPLRVTSGLCRALRSSLGRPPPARPPQQPRQQSSRHPKAKATVAPLHLAPPAVPPLFSSEDEEFPDPE